jgi:hypothetical protein
MLCHTKFTSKHWKGCIQTFVVDDAGDSHDDVAGAASTAAQDYSMVLIQAQH